MTFRPTRISNSIMVHTKIVTNLMCNGKGRPQANVFINAAAPFRLAHSSHRGQAQCSTGLIFISADVISSNKNCIIVVGNPIFWNGVSITLVGENGFLPFTEAIEGLVCMMVYLQVWLIFCENN